MKFYQAHIKGNETLLPDYIKREMQRVQFQSNLVNWGLGFEMMNISGNSICGHGGAYPGFITRSGMIPEKKLIVVILTNAINGAALELFLGIHHLLNVIANNNDLFTPAPPDIASIPEEILGYYQNGWGTSLFSHIDSKLIGIDPFAIQPAEFVSIYKQQDDLTFVSPKYLPLASPGETIEFKTDSKGNPVFVDGHGGILRKVEINY